MVYWHDIKKTDGEFIKTFFKYFYAQFGDWAGQLGDGRAVILGEYTNR